MINFKKFVRFTIIIILIAAFIGAIVALVWAATYGKSAMAFGALLIGVACALSKGWEWATEK